MSRARSPAHNGGQHLSRAALERPVRDGRNPEGALFRLARLGDIDPPDVRRAIPLAVDGLEHRLYPFFKALLRCLDRLAIHPGDAMSRSRQKAPPPSEHIPMTDASRRARER